MNEIRTTDQHFQALKALCSLWETAFPGTPDGERFQELVEKVDEYERTFHPIPPPQE